MATRTPRPWMRATPSRPNPDDDGLPASRIPLPFTFGDPSGSHSEKYLLTVGPVSVRGTAPTSFSWLNENYGECETKTAILKPGWRYEVRLHHAGTDPAYVQTPRPDYDYTLEIADAPASVAVSDPDGLFGVHSSSDTFTGAGKTATVHVLAPPKITANVDAEFQSYAWMIAKHESKSGSRVYNQFNPSNPLIELPNKTGGANRWGWGIAQIDKGENGDSTAEVYNWHTNVVAMNAILREKKTRDYERFIRYYREAYANDPSTQWVEPSNVTKNVDGYEVTAEMWGVLTLYNGVENVPGQRLPGRPEFRSPLQFDPVTTNWIFHANTNDYVRKVVEDRSKTEVE